ncbi:MAG TPA: aconitate hydratase AcnA, partial [Ktedonobacterales bacterium]
MASKERPKNAFGARQHLSGAARTINYFRLGALADQGMADLSKLPFTVKIFLENLLRNCGGPHVTEEDVLALARWTPGQDEGEALRSFSFLPARVLWQDFTGVPAVVDLAAMRDAVEKLGGDPKRINPLVPADLVIDHSVQVDRFGSNLAFSFNVGQEYGRNGERYALLRWAQQAFQNFSVVPPGTGIVHQVNLEYLAKVVQTKPDDHQMVAFPDTLVGTDSHTTMVNGLGVLGWGVGGIEAEAVLLGQPLEIVTPIVLGFRFTGRLPEGSTATDLVLTVAQMLRKKGVVGKFVEFSGPGLSQLPLADRATLANMAPEYGATAALFPVDEETLRYLRLTGRDEALIKLVERYTKEQGLFRTDAGPEPVFNDLMELDLATVEPSLAGPRRPQDRVPLAQVGRNFHSSFPAAGQIGTESGGAAVATLPKVAEVELDSERVPLSDGSVVIAAITSCTNTSNPAVMVGAGLLAKHAVERGLRVRPTVKTSLAPGSKVVTDYLTRADLMPYLEALGFHLVGYGCTTCLAEGTPVLLANGTTRRIEDMPNAGGSVLFGPTADTKLGMAMQTEAIEQGARECVSLVLQDGRTLTCTPDHEMLRADGRWVRADELVPGRDRVVVGLEAPLDEPGEDEVGYVLHAGDLKLTLDTPQERLRTLAFARLVGHLLSDGSISVHGQGRIHVGQAIDRQVVLNDIELLTGCRPAATRYDERKWAIVLPMQLTKAITALPGVRIGRRIEQAPTLPAFVLDENFPVAVVREFLGGLFGADGQAPVLHRWGKDEEDSTLEPPQFAQSARPEHKEILKQVMRDMLRLLARCGVQTNGARIYEYLTRQAASSYPTAQDGIPRVEVRLALPDGLSFVERVGFRYCIDKQMRSSAAAVYWRTVGRINEQRLWMAARLEELHESQRELTFAQARKLAAAELTKRETVIDLHYSLLEGHDRFTRLPQATTRKFQPLHRESCGFLSPVALFRQMRVREWFALLGSRVETGADTVSSKSISSKRYCVEKEALTLPTFSLQVADRQAAGKRAVYDLAVDDLHAFVAGTFAVHNCIGNSGPLLEPVSQAIQANNMTVVSVLSGNRNFEGRIHPEVRASYLASPPLVVAYALAGTVDVDLVHDPIGTDRSGQPVYLQEIWPSPEEISKTIAESVGPDLFKREYARVFEGDERWRTLPIPAGGLYEWDGDSTYVQLPPFFENLSKEPGPLSDITNARLLAMLGDSVTTDHISPAGSIGKDSPAGKYLIAHGVEQRDFNSYGARRGNHEVMMRGTFANVRLRNELAGGKEGGWTVHLPNGELMTIYDASMQYQREGTPLVIIGGREYGSGSSRDWAAKGTLLLGVKAVIVESYERIHRSNLIGMGVMPLEFLPGETRSSLGLTGREVYEITGIAEGLTPGKRLTVRARGEDGKETTFTVIARLDTPVEVEYYRQGGILPAVLRQL